MDNEKQHLFDDPKNVKRLLWFLYISCALLFALDFVIHRHVAHSWENLWGFYPIYGFVSCSILVFVATWMRTFLMRPEDYYDKDDSIDIDVKESPVLTKRQVKDEQHTKLGDYDVDA